MVTRLAENAPYWKRLDINAARERGQFTIAGCGDDRWEHDGIQFFGGNVGLALVRGTGMELQRPGSYVEAANGITEPIHKLARITHLTLRGAGILGVNHEHCAAFEGMTPIVMTGVETPGKTSKQAAREYARALAIAQTISGISQDRYDEVSAAQVRVAQHGVKPTDEAKAAMMPSGERFKKNEDGLLVPTGDGIPFVPLALPKHEAGLVVVTDDSRYTFDSMAAWETGSQAYHVGLGQLPRIQDALNPVLGNVDHRHARDALAVFTAKTVVNLPVPEGVDELTVQYLPIVEYAGV